MRIPRFLLQLTTVVAAAAIPAAAQAACAVKVGNELLTADFEAGRKAFLKCRACHTVKEGERNLVGPNLSRLFNREPNGAAGFTYSPAFQKAKPKWDVATLDAFLEKPSKAIPGNKMVFAGVAKPKERADLIAWLAKESGTPLPGCN